MEPESYLELMWEEMAINQTGECDRCQYEGNCERQCDKKENRKEKKQ